MRAAEHNWDLELTKDTPQLAVMDELWGVCYMDFFFKLTAL